MKNVIMGNIDGEIEKLAFEFYDIESIIPRYCANLIISTDGKDLMLELNGRTFPIHGKINKDVIRPYFILLVSGVVFNAIDYQILFNIEELPNNIIS